MDKKTLLLFSLCMLPGLGMLWTLIDPQFSNVQGTEWLTTVTSRIVFTVFCLVVSVISIVLILFKKYSTIDSLQDIIDKREICKMTDFIDSYISESHTTSDKESINEWVTKNIKKK